MEKDVTWLLWWLEQFEHYGESSVDYACSVLVSGVHIDTFREVMRSAITYINYHMSTGGDIMEKTPYDYLPSYYIDRPELFTYLENSPRTDYIVTIAIDGEFINELLQWECDDTWVWQNDWYEGQDNPTWVGIVAIEDVLTFVPETGDTEYKSF